MNYGTDQNISPNRAVRRRLKTVLSIKNKGGVGGSHLAMATATVLRMSAGGAFTTVLVDLDGSTGTTISKMGERDEDGHISQEQSLDCGVPAIDLFDPGQRGALFSLTEIEDRFLILDGPAASINTFKALTENLDAKEWGRHNESCGRDLVVMIPITPHLASIAAVPEAIAMFGDAARYIVVRSMLGCKRSDYVLWDAPEFRDRFGRMVSGRSRAMLEEAGGMVLDMPRSIPACSPVRRRSRCRSQKRSIRRSSTPPNASRSAAGWRPGPRNSTARERCSGSTPTSSGTSRERR